MCHNGKSGSTCEAHTWPSLDVHRYSCHMTPVMVLLMIIHFWDRSPHEADTAISRDGIKRVMGGRWNLQFNMDSEPGGVLALFTFLEPKLQKKWKLWSVHRNIHIKTQLGIKQGPLCMRIWCLNTDHKIPVYKNVILGTFLIQVSKAGTRQGLKIIPPPPSLAPVKEYSTQFYLSKQ
jgi:hypothetical protein